MLGFILSLKDEDGNDITSEDADILYNIVCDIISNTDDEIEDVVQSVAVVLSSYGWIFDYYELTCRLSSEL